MGCSPEAQRVRAVSKSGSAGAAARADYSGGLVRWPVPSPMLLFATGWLAVGSAVVGGLIVGRVALIAIALFGVLVAYLGLLWLFNASNAWHRWIRWRTSDTGPHPMLLGLTRSADYDSRWVSGPLAVLVGGVITAFAVLAATGTLSL